MWERLGLPQAGCGKQELMQDMEVGTSAVRSRCASWHGALGPKLPVALKVRRNKALETLLAGSPRVGCGGRRRAGQSHSEGPMEGGGRGRARGSPVHWDPRNPEAGGGEDFCSSLGSEGPEEVQAEAEGLRVRGGGSE